MKHTQTGSYLKEFSSQFLQRHTLVLFLCVRMFASDESGKKTSYHPVYVCFQRFLIWFVLSVSQSGERENKQEVVKGEKLGTEC